ncbi:hypothetical protein RHMOL_Rhmol12G0230600 [Rhododendron molle]|uniref:Uncharacterized protein n=1 Tax=Rhododendron molle TaxID=49168 RepID=A0ACC0LLL6_RHOML|nr:hypothetical protein RHMOL_Rhmol12G0230600 [Rhododendron molle]
MTIYELGPLPPFLVVFGGDVEPFHTQPEPGGLRRSRVPVQLGALPLAHQARCLHQDLAPLQICPQNGASSSDSRAPPPLPPALPSSHATSSPSATAWPSRAPRTSSTSPWRLRSPPIDSPCSRSGSTQLGGLYCSTRGR